MDGLAGPALSVMLAIFGVACASGLLRGAGSDVPHSLILGLAAACALLVLAQNLIMLALAIEATVVLGALLVARGRSLPASGRAAGLRYLAVAQAGALLLIIVLVRLSVLAHAPAPGLPELPVSELADVRARLSVAGPHALGTLAIL